MNAPAVGTMGWTGVAKEAARGLTAVRGRSALALVGIVIGIGSVIAMVSTGEIVRAEAMKQFEALGTDIVTARTHYVPRMGKVVTFPLDAIMAIESEVPEIDRAAGWNETSAGLVWRGRNIDRAGMLAVTGGFADVAGLRVVEGRFVSDLDTRRYCVIGAFVARTMREGATEQVLGQRVRLGEQLWTVVGVLAPTTVSRFNHAPDRSVFLPMRAALLYTDRAAVGDVIARTRRGVATEDGARALLQHLSTSAEGIAVRVHTAEQLIAGMRHQARLFAVLLATVGGIALIVGGVGIMNVMLISVSERRGEIGLRMAVGARRRDIRRHFVLEAMLLCTTGGLIGIGLGVVAAWAICVYSEWPFSVSLQGVAVGVGVSTAVGLLFGVHPALQAARLDPIAALRS